MQTRFSLFFFQEKFLQKGLDVFPANRITQLAVISILWHLHNWVFELRRIRSYASNGKLHTICKSNDQKSFVWLKFYMLDTFLFWHKIQVKCLKEYIATLFTEFTLFESENHCLMPNVFRTTDSQCKLAYASSNSSRIKRMEKFWCDVVLEFILKEEENECNYVNRARRTGFYFIVERAT